MTDSEKIAKIEAIIKKHEISCGETIYQSERVTENALEIILEICEIVGYYEEKENYQQRLCEGKEP